MHTFTFNHLALSVKDVDKSVEFYQKVFQFREIRNTASSSRTRWLSIGGGGQLHLIPRPELEVKTNKAVHFALSTPDFDSFVSQIIKLNIPYSDWRDTPDKRYIRGDGIRQIYFQDIDGYWIEVNNDC